MDISFGRKYKASCYSYPGGNSLENYLRWQCGSHVYGRRRFSLIMASVNNLFREKIGILYKYRPVGPAPGKAPLAPEGIPPYSETWQFYSRDRDFSLLRLGAGRDEGVTRDLRQAKLELQDIFNGLQRA